MGARNVEEPKKSKIKKIKLDDIELINLDEETKKKKRQKKGEDDEEKIKLDGEVLKKNYERIRRKEENNKELFENLDPTVIDFVIQKLKEIVETLNVRTPKAFINTFAPIPSHTPIANGTKKVDAIVPDATPPESNATAVIYWAASWNKPAPIPHTM